MRSPRVQLPFMKVRALPSFVLVASLLFHFSAVAQKTDTTKIEKTKRKQISRLITVTSATYALGMGTLYQVWYKNSQSQSFRFFNDNAEWKQVDKVGHVFTAFHLSNITSTTLKKYSMPKGKADLVGSMSGFLMMLPIEIFDGFSNSYGASSGDLVANATGSLLYFSQQAIWDEIRIIPKFSFHYTSYPSYRPDLLGDNWYSQIIKDYNGQTYWLSFDTHKFFGFSKWVNLSIGYGADNMVYARDGQNISKFGLTPHRQYYLSFDIDLTEINTKFRFLAKIFSALNMLKFPAPSLEYSKKHVHLHALYF